jgi:hypothetical protein
MTSYSRQLAALLGVLAVQAFLDASSELPTGWKVHVLDDHHVAAGRVARVPSLLLPSGTYLAFVAAVTFDVRDGEAAATASGLTLRCCGRRR